MISALDTNVLLDVLIPNPTWYGASLAAIESAARDGSLVVCEIVYAELCGHFSAQADLDAFLHENRIRLDRLSPPALFAASQAWRQYRLHGGKRDRILPDFLVGAHARLQASRLVSRDGEFYRRYFEGLVVAGPES
ncbi:MAG: type II toxin-antitoxin system VapC family toxin [Bryobacteraceae bacterium]